MTGSHYSTVFVVREEENAFLWYAVNIRKMTSRIGRETMYCVCKSCIEHAIERFVDEFEDAPDMVDLKETEFADWDPPRKCDLCEAAAEVLVV